ncbi:PAS domain S-box protein [uncultured Desulfobacter sp.]|uniref:hybrid sensor histidine kinase/response regulator n=1 Tax=uncultured Desulfobacter sp. TaxID=240139 RepID=UPI0029C651AE|nr:PAS domain S-box protein [uncultured Desulfobacter sp.]
MKKISILAVDDRPENLLALENLLESPELEIVKAGSGDEALSKTIDHEFALILLDVQMPGMDGYETAELLRSVKKTSKIPIIFVTAANKEDHHVFKGYESGAVDYLLKPLEPVILTSKVKIFIELHRQRILLEEKTRDLDAKVVELEALKFELEEEVKERKKAEEKQKRTTNFIRALLDAVPTPVFYKDKEGRYQGCNNAFSTFMGLTPDDIRGKRVDELWPGDQAAVYHQKDLELMQNSRHQIYEFKVTDKNGEAKPVIFAKDVFRDEKGTVAGIIGAFSDISELKQTQEEIRRLRNYLSNIIDSMPSILIGVDNETRITHWNLRARKITRISEEVAKGQSLEKIFPQLENWTEYVQKAIESQQVYHHSRSTRQEKDRVVYEDITIYPLVTDGVGGAVIRIDDVTERVKMEEMMTETEKMLSVGGLAAGIAHEINNPLAGMMQSAYVMKSRLESKNMPANLQVAEKLGIKMEDIWAFMDKRDIFRMIDAINDSGSRAAEIVNTMLSFARKSNAGDMSSHYPNTLMDEILELAAADYDLKKKYDFKSIEIIKQYDEKLPMLLCEGARIQQVLLNILRNGAQAMHTAKTKFPRFIIRIYKVEESEMICMEIEDNGPGMDEETRSKVFDPFFTTKPVGIGTGLGLSVSYFIITKNHKGKIDVISEPGNGATFIIRLPIERDST